MFKMRSLLFPLISLHFALATSINFPFEAIQLTPQETTTFPAISFGNTTSPLPLSQALPCRSLPSSPTWPPPTSWTHLNATLSGALLQPLPPGTPCYPGPLQNLTTCKYLLSNARSSRFYIDDPLTVLTSWTQGNTCIPSLNPKGNCIQGGFPVYVVNATTVRQIQIAVNFARNWGLRLVVKNTGHDFSGRSTGMGALSIWTHYLKDFEFLPEFKQGPYEDMAARVGAGLEAWELYRYMDIHDMTLVVPGGSTVGAYGGWMAGGGHSTLASTYGLGSDQPLSIQVVTADGKFVTASPDENEDLFYALRGGGPGTFGIVTSAVVKAYPPIYVSESSLTFRGGSLSATQPFGPFPNFTLPPNITLPTNFTFNLPLLAPTVNLTTFWAGINAFMAYGQTIVANGGTTYNYITPLANQTFNFRTTIEMPGLSPLAGQASLQELYNTLNNLGIPVNNTLPVTSLSWGDTRKGQGDAPGETRFASRLFPRNNWDNGPLFEATMDAIRTTVEAGYSFHGIHMGPTEEVAGYPGNSGVNPAFRSTLMHADIFASGSMRDPAAKVMEDHRRFDGFMDLIRRATVGGGSYINEADVQEPGWQESFFGEKYERLLEIKRKYDPWGLFWAPGTVGSEGWEVKTEDGLPTQNGPLCRVGG